MDISRIMKGFGIDPEGFRAEVDKFMSDLSNRFTVVEGHVKESEANLMAEISKLREEIAALHAKLTPSASPATAETAVKEFLAEPATPVVEPVAPVETDKPAA